MIGTPPRPPRQPKLRSSCDACGAAKLKCDRGRPHCGRCLPLGIPCVYGVSRKMGKPRRERLRISEVPNVSRTLSEYGSSVDKERSEDENCSNGNGGSMDNGVDLSSERYPSVNNVSSAWSAVDVYPSNFITSVDGPDALQLDLFESSPPNFTSLDFGNDLISTLGSPGLEHYSTTSAAQTKASHTQVDETSYFDRPIVPPTGSQRHDCFREAQDLLGSLSFTDLNKDQSIPPSPLDSSSTKAGIADKVPLDHLLCILREVSERLSRLLTCSCARSPHLALLHASIISRILSSYQQAAGCAQSTSWESIATKTPGRASHQVPLVGCTSNSGPGTVTGSSTGSNTTPNTLSTSGAPSTPSLKSSIGLAVGPAKMAIGAFDVDDLCVQSALKIQLLSGEMRRAGRLIDQLTSHYSSGKCFIDNYTFGGVDSLYQSLDAWLRGEHSRIVNMMRSNLRELNT